MEIYTQHEVSGQFNGDCVIGISRNYIRSKANSYGRDMIEYDIS